MKKVFPLLFVLIFSIISTSCDSLFSGVGEGGSSSIAQVQGGNSGGGSRSVSVTLTGRISCYGTDMPALDGVPDSLGTPSDAKSAVPDLSGYSSESQDKFFMYAVNGVTEVEGTVTKDPSVTPPALNYTITLGAGTWTLTAGIKNDSGNIVISGKKTFTISDSTPLVEDLEITISPLQTAGGTGGISLEMSVDSSITDFTMECISGNASEWNDKTEISLQSGSALVEVKPGQTIASGTYLVGINFYAKNAQNRKYLAYSVTQKIDVFDNMVTDKWYSEGNGSVDAAVITDGVLCVTEAVINSFQAKTLYVDGTNGKTIDDGANGTWINPYKSVCEAVSKINFYSINDATVFVAGTTGETDVISIVKKCTIKQWPGEAAGTIRRNGNNSSMISVTAAGTLVMESLTIDGAGVEVPSDGAGLKNEGTATLSSIKIKNCKTEDQGLGGGINNSGIMEITGGEISGCEAGLGGGIFTKTGTLEITGVLISGCTADEGGGIYNEKELAISGGKINGCTAKLGSAIYTKGISGSSEDNVKLGGGLEITANITWEGTIRAEVQAKIKADGVKVYGNDAYSRAGALYIAGGSRFTMDSGEIYDNNAKKLSWPGTAGTGEGDGGAIFLWGGSGNTGSFIMNGGSIYGNVAEGNGGCIYIQDDNGKASSFTMTAGSVYGNSAEKGKAVYHTEGGKINLSGSAYIAADNEIYLGSSNDFYVTVAGTLTPPAEAAGTVAHILKENAAAGRTVLGGTAALVQSEYGKFEYDGAFDIDSSGKLAAVIYIYGQAATSGDGSMTSPKKQLSAAYSSVKTNATALIYVAGTTSEGAATNIASGDALTEITVKQWPQDKWEKAGHTGTVPKAVIGNGTMVTSNPLITIATGKTALFNDITIDGNSLEHSNMYGGGINNSGDLTLDNVIVKRFVVKSTTDAVYGGGIYNAGTLTVEDAVISECKVTSTGSSKISRGGGIYNKGTATIKKAIITGCEIQGTDTSRCNGGGIANYENGAVLTLGDGVLDGGTPDVIIGIGTYNGVGYTTPNKGTRANGIGVASGVFPSSGSTTLTLNKDCVIGKYNPGSAATSASCGNYSKGSSAGLNCSSGTNITIDGAHITYNYVENYAGNIAGGIAYFNSSCIASIKDLDISYNRANNSAGSDFGLMIATYGYKFENLKVHDNVWNSASSAKGHGMYVYENERVEFAGSTCFDTDADVYLKDGSKIQIDSTLTATEVAAITPQYYNVDSSGAAVDPIQLLAESSSGLISGNYSKFAVTSPDPAVEWYVTSEGKLNSKLPGEILLATLSEAPADTTKVYIVDTSEELAPLATWVNAGNTLENINFKLNSDITLDNTWTPIGNFSSTDANKKPFKGKFDGNGKTITFDSSSKALFDYAVESEISNVKTKGTFTPTSSKNNSGSGTVVNYLKGGKLSNCENYATITASTNNVGGIIGKAEFLSADRSCIIDNCINTGNITSSSSVGGIVGAARSVRVINCYNSGYITGTYAVGGIAGWSGGNNGSPKGTLGSLYENCGNVGTVKATAPSTSGTEKSGAGGIAGGNTSSNDEWMPDFINCWSAGQIIASSNLNGGIFGSNLYKSFTSCTYMTGTAYGYGPSGASASGTDSGNSVSSTNNDIMTKLNNYISTNNKTEYKTWVVKDGKVVFTSME